jgi:hypothetical protein
MRSLHKLEAFILPYSLEAVKLSSSIDFCLQAKPEYCKEHSADSESAGKKKVLSEEREHLSPRSKPQVLGKKHQQEKPQC